MKVSNHITRRLSVAGFVLPFLLMGCASSGMESAPKTSLFGGSNRAARGLPRAQGTDAIPPSAIGTQRPIRGGEALQTPSALLPQLNNAMSGNSAATGLAQPMVRSPLLFQRLDKNTWRVATTAGHLFQTIARILSQTYIIAQADRHALSLSTDWDKFFIDGRLFRNRISINVFPHSARSADLIIKNNIEYYVQNAQKIDENSPTQWLPTQDVTDEVDRVLEKTQTQLIAQLSSMQAR